MSINYHSLINLSRIFLSYIKYLKTHTHTYTYFLKTLFLTGGSVFLDETKFQWYLLVNVWDFQNRQSKPIYHLPIALRSQGRGEWAQRLCCSPSSPCSYARQSQEQTRRQGLKCQGTYSPRTKDKQITYQLANSPFMFQNLRQGLRAMKVPGALHFPVSIPQPKKVFVRDEI